MKKIKFIAGFILIVCLGLCFFLFKSSPAKYIFLITLDTTREDHIDYSLSDNQVTPNLAKLAAEGARFENAFALIPITLPSHASIFYSLPPHRLKIYNNLQVCEISLESVAELLKKKGFRTGAVISLGVLEPEFGLDKGFDRYIGTFREGIFYKTADEVNREVFKMLDGKLPGKAFYWIHYSDPHGPYYSPAYNDGTFRVSLNRSEIFSCKAAEQLLVKLNLDLVPGKNSVRLKTKLPKKITENKNIVIDILSYMDFKIHPESLPRSCEMVLPPEWHRYKIGKEVTYNCKKRKSKIFFFNRSKENIKVTLSFIYKIVETPSSSRFLYKEEIQYMDKGIGKLIEFLKKKGIYEESVFIIMGDHGEGLGEHRELVGHVHYLNRLYVQVPLVIFGKGIKKREVCTKMVSNLNIAPTILDLAGIKKPGFMLGESLLKPVKNKPLLLETYSPEAHYDGLSLLDFPYQVIYYPKRKTGKLEFFDLSSDLLGTRDIQGNKKQLKAKVELTNSILKLSKAIIKLKEKGGEVTEKQKEILKSLGYL